MSEAYTGVYTAEQCSLSSFEADRLLAEAAVAQEAWRRSEAGQRIIGNLILEYESITIPL